MGREGFTLIEAMVSMAILSLVGIAALGAVGRDLDAAGRARTALESATLAQDRLESIRLLDAAALVDLPDSLEHGRFARPFERYTWAAGVAPRPQWPPGLVDVRVVISWPGGSRPLEAVLFREAPGTAP